MYPIHRDPRVEALVDALAGWFASPRSDPFAFDLVVVSAEGVDRWLAAQLAQRWGVCAGVRFVGPREALESAFAEVLGPVDVAAWSENRLTWRIVERLPSLLDDPAFLPLNTWLARSDEPDPLPTLARRLAASFADYPIWRPDAVRAWQAGDDAPTAPAWTAPLWRALAEAAYEPREGRYLPHFADRAGQFAAAPRPSTRTSARVALFQPGEWPPIFDTSFQRWASIADVRAFEREPPARAATVVLHACAGVHREVEVLREALLERFAADPSLTPRDVLVVAPDLQLYAPRIVAAFLDGADADAGEAGHPSGRPAIPVLDPGLGAGEPATVALVALLDLLCADRFDAPSVMAFLASPLVSARFGLSNAVDEAAARLASCGVRWGLDAEHVASHGLSPSARFTWRLALALLEAPPPDAISASLARFVAALLNAAADRAPRPMPAWIDVMWRWSEQFFADEAGAPPRPGGVGGLAALADASPTLPLTIHTIRAWLRQQAPRSSRRDPRADGGVTVARLGALRGVPFRVVAAVGLHDGAFPRTALPPSLDLRSTPMVGDPAPGDEDRAALRDLIAAASDHVILTFTGQDPVDGSPRAPAPSVVAASGVSPRRHPLHAHDPAQRRARPPRWRPAAAPSSTAAIDARSDEAVLPLTQLASFLADPIAFGLERRFGPRPSAFALSEREPLRADRDELAEVLMYRRLSGVTSPASLMALEAKADRVPRGRRGKLDFDDADRRAIALAATITRLRGAPRPDRPVRVRTGRHTWVGDLTLVGETTQVRVWLTGPVDTRLLSAWVWHLAAQHGGEPLSTVALVDGRAFTLAPVAGATALLSAIAELFDAPGPVPLFASASRHHRAGRAPKWSPSESERSLLGDLRPWDPAARELWAAGVPDFSALAEQIWGPIEASLAAGASR
jgi:exonuclease V gamma subunit